MPSEGVTILNGAIARNLAIVLSLPSEGILRHHKSRFLSEDQEGFWIEAAPEDQSLVEELIASNTPVGISFRSGPQKVSFITPIIKRDNAYQMNADTTLPALQLAMPDDVRAVQRRNNFRVRVAEDSDLFLRVWRIPDHFYLTDRPASAQEIAARVRDISIGGMGVLISPKGKELPKVVSGERLRISLRFRQMEELILEGRLRFVPPEGAPTPIRCGVQFKKLEDDLEGRQNLAALTRIVGELQREEVRRTRLETKAA